MRTEENWAEAVNALVKENKKLKTALEALTVDNARLIEERNQMYERRATLSKKYEEMREHLQSDQKT